MKTGLPGTGTPTNKERLLRAYAAYNRRDSEALLALVSEDLDWPDDSARLHGKARAAGVLDAPMGGDAHPR
jgi:ketosteroid isomerase-like protein